MKGHGAPINYPATVAIVPSIDEIHRVSNRRIELYEVVLREWGEPAGIGPGFPVIPGTVCEWTTGWS